ncbi:NAD(P)H-dependent flavin oxidoreductase [Pseudoneobacillus rhizosphaerae]|uniref:Probable nitronate monooxygenase n=1 Tax=Pseudoneobacillus rhizosphaerae TaxID=2880968 RepID=A0A9C7L9H7_9BACI|nr:nitronate monooxygenase [Pseudoneobacillus rhizosphaerae]CAG9606450.1 NADH:quinone reductase [Pseudoneobacillus rhizosphaerae]
MNRLTQFLNIQYPILQGGMGNISNAPLTAAVSEAGGLGTIGVGTMTPDEVEKIILETKALTSKQFALNIPISVTPYLKEMLMLLLKHKIQVVSLSAGNPSPYIENLHKNGVKVIAVVASVKHALKAEAAGVDILVAEGYEAAGINSPFETTTMTLIPQIVNAVDIPVVGAGGIADGRGLAAAICLGASGVQMGTRFIATKEAPFHTNYKEKILFADDTSTVIIGRSVGKIRRVLQAPYTGKLLEYEKKGMTDEEYLALTSEDLHKRGAIEGNEQEGFMNAGQIAGMVSTIPTVKELMEGMMEEARTQLQRGIGLFKL